MSCPRAGKSLCIFLSAMTTTRIRPSTLVRLETQIARLKSHNAERDFWQRALIVVSKTQSLTQTHTLFLENYCIGECRKAGRYNDENGNAGTKPYAPPPLEADCLEIFDTARTLLSTLGCPVFEPLAQQPFESDPEGNLETASDLYFCTGSEADGRGRYTSDGLVVLKGSSGRIETASSFAVHAYAGLRDELIESGVCKIQDDRFVFIKDHAFKRPSTASVALQGRAGNGWLEWKDSCGRTLDELVRKAGIATS